MVNTVTQKTLFGDATTRKVVRSVHLVSDGSEETSLVIWDNSAFINNTAKGRLLRVWVMGYFTGPVRLSWDQATDENIISVGQTDDYLDFRSFGGFRNPNGTTPVGDILLTTTELANLDEFTLIIEVEQS